MSDSEGNDEMHTQEGSFLALGTDSDSEYDVSSMISDSLTGATVPIFLNAFEGSTQSVFGSNAEFLREIETIDPKTVIMNDRTPASVSLINSRLGKQLDRNQYPENSCMLEMLPTDILDMIFKHLMPESYKPDEDPLPETIVTGVFSQPVVLPETSPIYAQYFLRSSPVIRYKLSRYVGDNVLTFPATPLCFARNGYDLYDQHDAGQLNNGMASSVHIVEMKLAGTVMFELVKNYFVSYELLRDLVVHGPRDLFFHTRGTGAFYPPYPGMVYETYADLSTSKIGANLGDLVPTRSIVRVKVEELSSFMSFYAPVCYGPTIRQGCDMMKILTDTDVFTNMVNSFPRAMLRSATHVAPHLIFRHITRRGWYQKCVYFFLDINSGSVKTFSL